MKKYYWRNNNKFLRRSVISWWICCLGLLCTVALAYLLQENWRLLQVVYSAPALLCLVYWWIAPESGLTIFPFYPKYFIILVYNDNQKKKEIFLNDVITWKMHEDDFNFTLFCITLSKCISLKEIFLYIKFKAYKPCMKHTYGK